MRYIDFKEKLKDFIVFNTQDIRKLESDFDLRRLNEWQNKKYIKMVRRGFYIFSDLEINEAVLFLIANKIYSPSYVSLEVALSHYNLIPEGVYEITSVTPNKTNNFNTEIGDFAYSRIKPELMFGYNLLNYKNQNFKIAEIEKALLDYFYLNPQFKSNNDFAEMRFNADEFKEKSNKKKIENYLKTFNNKRMKKRLENFFSFINYA